jgi:DNA-binding PadR family transcriptional regulator
MKVRNPEEVKPPPKGLMLLVMRAISMLGGKADTFEIRDYIATVMKSEYPIANITVMLWRLERRKLVASQSPVERAKAGRGRPRKIFSLTPGGKAALDMGMRIFTASNFDKEVDPHEIPATAKAC